MDDEGEDDESDDEEEDDESDEHEEDDGNSEQDQRNDKLKGKRRNGRAKGNRRKGARGSKGSGNATNRKHKMDSKTAANQLSHVLRKARELASDAIESRRADLDLSEIDSSEYEELLALVQNEVTQLRAILQSVDAKERERTWLRGKTTGELDGLYLTLTMTLMIGARDGLCCATHRC